MLVSGVWSSEKRPSDARCGTCLSLDKKSLLSSEMSVKSLTVFHASILAYGFSRRHYLCSTPIRFGKLEDNQLVRTFETVLTLPPKFLIGSGGRSAHRRSHCPASSTKLQLEVLVDRKATQECEVVQKLRCAEHDAAEGIVGEAHRQTGFIPDLLV